MAMEDTDHTKFNMNSLQRLTNKERDKQLTLGVYNGVPQISLNTLPFEKGTRPKSIQVNDILRNIIIEKMQKILDAPGPDKKFPIIINGRWNPDTRKKELSTVLTIGMDDTGICFIGVKHIDDQGNNFIAKFELTGDRNIESADYDDDKSRSLSTMRMLKHFLEHAWPIGAFFTRNHLVTKTFTGGNGGGNRGNNYRGGNGGGGYNKMAAETKGDDDIF